ncbi:hypothetical protein Tco_1535803 [Tanacetum coccineum]
MDRLQDPQRLFHSPPDMFSCLPHRYIPRFPLLPSHRYTPCLLMHLLNISLPPTRTHHPSHLRPLLAAPISDVKGRAHLNPAYSAWVRTDQSVRSWLNATLSQRFDQFTTKEMKLKFDIQNNMKGNKPMDAYLRELKSMVDALAAINSLLCPKRI